MLLMFREQCNIGATIIIRQNLSRGGKIMMAYILITYIVPLVLNLLFETDPFFRIPIDSPFVMMWLLFFIFVGIFAVFASSATPTIVPQSATTIKPIPKILLFLFSIICIIMGMIIFENKMASWRYSHGLSTSGPLLMVVALLQGMIPVVCYWVLITDHKFLFSKSLKNLLLKVMLFLALALSINGLGASISGALFAIVFFKPDFAMKYLYVCDSSIKKRGFAKKMLSMIFAILFIFSTFSIGLYVKESRFINAAAINDYLNWQYLIDRHSVHLSIAAASIEDGHNISSLSIPVDTFTFRVKTLLGMEGAIKPEVSTFARLALIQFADLEEINPTGGATPGLLGALTMILPLPIVAVFLFLFVFLLVKIIDYIMCRQPPFSWLGAFCFTYITLGYVVNSPLDMFLPGPTLLAVLFPVLMGLRREKKHHTFIQKEAV